MLTPSAVRRTLLLAAAISAVAPTGRANAQSHAADVPKLSIGVAAGVHGGSLLWTSDQVISAGVDDQGRPLPPSTFALRREVQSGFTFTGHVNAYVNQHLGFTGELDYLGLKFKDTCKLSIDGGNPGLKAACAAVGSANSGVDQSGSTFLINAGVLVRPFKGGAIDPYVKGMVGVANAPRNSVALQSAYTDPGTGPNTLVIYPDVDWSPVRPTATAGAGIQITSLSGLHFVAEFRDTWMAQSIVTGPSAGQNAAPASKSSIRSVPSFLVGIDIILKAAHGKRY